jgi:FSR family fosmidomycin resistance protein-like MFS transporter
MEDSKSFQTGKVLLVSFGHLMHDIYTSFLAPILPLLIEKFGLSYSMASLLALMQRLPNLLNPFLGLLADRIAMRYLVIITPAATAITMSLIGLSPSFTFAAILLFLTGISSALFHVPTPVMIRRVSGENLGRGMSFYMFGGEMARTLGPLIVLGAVSLWGLEGTFKLLPFGILASILLYIKLRDIKISDAFKKDKKVVGIGTTFRRFIPFFIILIGITFFRSVMRASLTNYLPTYLTLRGESLWVGGVFLSILELSGALGVLFWGSYSDRIGRRRALMIIVLAAPVLMFFFTTLSIWWSLPILILLGFFLLGTTPILLALVQERAKERPAFFNGMFLMISFGSEAVSLMLVGVVGDWIGLVETFRLAPFVALGAIPFVFLLGSESARRQKTPSKG